MGNMDRPNRQTLISFAEGELPAGDAAKIERTLAGNAAAAEFVQAYRTTRSIASSDDMSVPSEAAVTRGIAIFDAAILPARTSWFDALEQIVASLIFDSRVHEVALRQTAEAECVELTFEVGTALIDIRADRMSADGQSRWRMMGQVDLGGGEESATRARVLEQGTNNVIADSVIDEDGVFTVDVPAGEFEIWLEVNERAIVLRPVVVK